jgi:hypothetical protein
MVSTETESMLTDMAAEDDPATEGAPTKMARVGGSEEDPGEGLLAVEGTKAGNGVLVEARREEQDLQKDALEDLQLTQGPRTKTIPYTRRAAQTPSTSMRKSRGVDFGQGAKVGCGEEPRDKVQQHSER